MKIYMKKKLRQLFEIVFNQKNNNSLEANTKLLRLHKKSDVDRWSQNQALYENWNQRTELLATYLSDSAKIIEFGAGLMHMKQLLKHNQVYTPSDIVKRFPATFVFDLNEPLDLDLSSYDTVVFSGVLEYVYDIKLVFDKLKKEKIKYIILSYCCSDLIEASREENGWLSDYTISELKEIFKNSGYTIVSNEVWNKQSVFNLIME
jgi:hypothetical protein